MLPASPNPFAAWLNAALQELGWNTLDLALRAGLSPAQVLIARYGPPGEGAAGSQVPLEDADAIVAALAAARGQPLDQARRQAGLPPLEPPFRLDRLLRDDLPAYLRARLRATPVPLRLPLFHAVLTFLILAGLPHHPMTIPTALGVAYAVVYYVQVLAYRRGYRLRISP